MPTGGSKCAHAIFCQSQFELPYRVCLVSRGDAIKEITLEIAPRTANTKVVELED